VFSSGRLEPIVDACLGRLLAKDGFVGLHQKVVAVEPVELIRLAGTEATSGTADRSGARTP
jgi:hypothetical protein